MPQTSLQDQPLPSFLDLDTLGVMREMALSLAVARNLVIEIAKAEEYLMSNISREEQVRTVSEIVNFARKMSTQAVNTWMSLQRTKMQVSQFEKELHNATN